MESSTDIHRELISDCLKGDQQAHNRLYHLYARAMFNVAYRLTGNIHDAEDALQEAFIQVFRGLASYRFESSLGAWLKKIVVNTTINNMKKRRVELKYEPEIHKHKVTEEEIRPESLTVDQVLSKMELLPHSARVIFSLYLLEGYDHQEIASILNISESTSKTQYMRAKNKMKELLTTKHMIE